MMALFRLVLLLFLSSCTAVLADFLFDIDAVSVYSCSENSTISTPQMSANINSLVAELASSASQNRFSVATYGNGTDQVYGLGQCRRDLNGKDCTACLHNTTQTIRTYCANRADVWMWYNDTCFLRFTETKFYGIVDPSTFTNNYLGDHPQHPTAFKKQLDALISKVSSDAIVPANEAVGKGRSFSVASNATIYALAQCTRDLSQHSCNECLNTVTGTGNLLKFCNNEKTVGCRVASTGCYVHYETYQFYYPLDL